MPRVRKRHAPELPPATKRPDERLGTHVSTSRSFVEAYNRSGLNGLVGHDSYLINLASPDPALRDRSIDSLVAELERCQQLGIGAVVSHPGNYIDDRKSGLVRNAEGCTAALECPRE
jgi:deoxyribonuclease-4